ncbi:MAG TPA: hypothetical protein V6C89_21325 [Drouetiella sp.]|jgi:hypothetical protein
MYQQLKARIEGLIDVHGVDSSVVQTNIEWLNHLMAESKMQVDVFLAPAVLTPTLFTQLQDSFLTSWAFLEPVPVYESAVWTDSLRMAAIALAATARNSPLILTFLQKDGYALLSEIASQYGNGSGNLSDRELKEYAKSVLEEKQWAHTDLSLESDPARSKFAVAWLLAVIAASPRLYVR